MPPTSDSLAPVWSALRALLVAVGGIMAANGLGGTSIYKWVQIASGAVLIIGPAAWGVYVAIANHLKLKQATAIGVQSGINLTLQGQTLTADGAAIPVAESPPAKPVTVESAQQIVQQFGPSVTPALK